MYLLTVYNVFISIFYAFIVQCTHIAWWLTIPQKRTLSCCRTRSYLIILIIALINCFRVVLGTGEFQLNKFWRSYENDTFWCSEIYMFTCKIDSQNNIMSKMFFFFFFICRHHWGQLDIFSYAFVMDATEIWRVIFFHISATGMYMYGAYGHGVGPHVY